MTDEANVYLILTPEKARTLHDFLATQAKIADGLQRMIDDVAELSPAMRDSLDAVAQPIIDIRDDLQAAMDRAEVPLTDD